MIIGIDTRISTKNKTGVAYLLENIVPAMLEKDNSNHYKLLGSSFGIKKQNVKTYSFPKIVQRGLNFLWKNIFFPPVDLLIGETNIFFFTNFVDFPAGAKKKVLLVPDMSFIKFPQFTERKNLKFLKRGVAKSIKRADQIITISQNAKDEICDVYHLKSDRVKVIYPGCPRNIEKINDQSLIQQVKNKYGISEEYILFFGTIEPRKNLKRLVEAYASLDGATKKNYKLVLAGGKGWYYQEIFDIVKDKGLQDRVVFTGYISERDRSVLYSGSSLFVLPSIYEGFGLPILEAFACGIPVVCSNASSLPEVGGHAAIYFNPENISDITNSIKKVLFDLELRKNMIRRGYDQQKKFSWDTAAEETLKILLS